MITSCYLIIEIGITLSLKPINTHSLKPFNLPGLLVTVMFRH
jgi:hypothetical protein